MAIILFFIGASAQSEDIRSALIEETGINGFAENAQTSTGFDALSLSEKLMSGELRVDADMIERALRRFGASVREDLLDALKALAAPLLAGIAVQTLLGSQREAKALSLLCRVACVLMLMERFETAREVCEASLNATVRLVEAATPVLISALTLTGASQRATILTPSSALCASLIEGAFQRAALPLCCVAAAVASSANLSERFRLNRLFELIKSVVVRGVKLLLSAFVGLMALQGLLVNGTEALSERVLRRAIQSALPIIGGEVSDSAGSLLTIALSVRSLAGITGLVAIIGASVTPIIRLAISALSLRLASAALEPIADRGMTRIISSFADLSRMLLAICAGATLLAALTLGACLSLSFG